MPTKSPYRARPYKSRFRKGENYEVLGPDGKVLGLPMSNNETTTAMRWLEIGHSYGVAELRDVLEDMTANVEEYRRVCQTNGQRPMIGHQTVRRARKLLDKLAKVEKP